MTSYTEPGPTLTPDDMPLEMFARLERTLRDRAITQADNARDAIARDDLTGALVRYENGMANFHAATELSDIVRQAAIRLAETHRARLAEEQGKEPGDDGQPELPGITQSELDDWHEQDQSGTVRDSGEGGQR